MHGHGQACGRHSQHTAPCLAALPQLQRWRGAGQACSTSPAAQGARWGKDPPSPWQSRRVLGRQSSILKSTAKPAPCPTSARVLATGKQPRAQTQPLVASIFPGSIFPDMPQSRSTTASHVSAQCGVPWPPGTSWPHWHVSQRGKENKVRMSPPQPRVEKSFPKNTLLIPH